MIRVFDVAIRRNCRQVFAGFSLEPEWGTHFLAAVPNVVFVDNVDERDELIVLLVGTVHTAVDGNEPHVILWECDLGIHPNFQIISTDAAHALRDDRANLPFFHQRHHALPIRSLKVRARVTVIHKELRIAEAVFLCISAEIGFLIHNAVTVAL